jgi:hypothetical protein
VIAFFRSVVMNYSWDWPLYDRADSDRFKGDARSCGESSGLSSRAPSASCCPSPALSSENMAPKTPHAGALPAKLLALGVCGDGTAAAAGAAERRLQQPQQASIRRRGACRLFLLQRHKHAQ